jgi:hypothetical protein
VEPPVGKGFCSTSQRRRNVERRSKTAAILALAVVLAASTPGLALGASWSKPQLVGPTNCFSVDATIDSAGRYHLAATCSGSIRYSTSTGDGHWATTVFRHPYELRDLNPRIAVDGNFVYLAYSRTDTAAGACDDGIVRLAVYYRRRSLPDGTWSAPKRIGQLADQLMALEVRAGTVQAILWNANDGRFYYQTVNGGVSHRYLIPGDGPSLSVGTDGRARIAYGLAGSVRYSLFSGSGFWRTRVTGSSGGSAPSLALGEGDGAYLLWTRRGEFFCGSYPEPVSADGTYFGTNTSGAWLSRRVTTDVGATALTSDPSTGRVYALLASDGALALYMRSPAGAWSGTNIGPGFAWSPVIRRDPTTGTLLVVYISEYRVIVVTKR